MVTNTTVVPSSSESEDGEIQRERWRRRSNTWTSQIRPHTEREKASDQGLYTPKPPPNPTPSRHDSRNFDVGPPKSTRVGLGLKLTHGEVRDDRAQETDEDDESIYDDEASLQGSDVDNGQERDHRFPGIASHRLATGRQTSIDYDPACNLRRQEALLGIVNGLQQDFRLSVSPKGRGRLSHSDSDGTYVSQGIAIGASGDLCLNSPRTSFGRDPRPREDCQQGKGVEEFSYENGPNKHQSVRKSVLIEGTTRRDDSYRRDVDSSTHSKRNSKRRSSSVPASSRSSRMYASEIANKLQGNHCPPQHDEHLRRGANQRPHHHLVDKRETAVREREGFGIPPSLSYGAREECEGIHTPTSAINQLNEDPKSQIRLEEQSPSELPHFDSESSSVGGNWRGSGEAGHWTVGAEALFRQLSTCSTNGNERPRMGRRDLPSDSYTVGSRAWDPGPRRDKALHQTRLVHQRSPSIISASSSAPSVYDVPSAPQDPVDSSRTIFEETDIQGSWQATMRQSTYKAFLTEYGAEELGRQELIYQFFCSEEDFVIRLRAVVELFILPLRQKDSRKWLPGIPCRVSRLFDWLDDIQSLHTAIANTLKTSLRVWKTGGVVIRFAEALRGFIPRLEIYQPYLARVDEVRELVDACANDHNDEFGEYVRLREDEYGAEGWSLLKLLDEPVQHLSRYTSIFLVSRFHISS